MNHFTSIKDVQNIRILLDEAMRVKQQPHLDHHLGKNKTMCLLFFNPSLRTRISTQKAAQNLGMNVIVMNVSEDSWKIETEYGVVMDGDKAEHIKEAAGVLGEYSDIIGIRAFAGLKNKEYDMAEPIIHQFLQYANTPVISLESSTGHPLQAFADVITIESHKKIKKPKVVLTWAPHPKPLPHAVANSFAEWSLAAGYDLVITHPEGYELDEKYTNGANIITDQEKAFEGADFIYAKNWSSYRQYGKVLSTDRSWTVTQEKMALTNNARFLHCLPVRRNMVVSDEVLDSKSSIVVEQAGNRVVSAQTIIKEITQTL